MMKKLALAAAQPLQGNALRRHRPRHSQLRPARHDASRRWFLFRRRRRQRRARGQVLLLDATMNCRNCFRRKNSTLRCATSESQRKATSLTTAIPNPLKGQNVLSVVNPLPPAHGRSGVSEERRQLSSKGSAALFRDAATTIDDSALLASVKKKMLAARSKRVRPHLDDKILASWNGLMLGAMARAYAVLGDEKYRAAAEKNLAFIQEKLWEAQSSAAIYRLKPTRTKRAFRQRRLEACSTTFVPPLARWRTRQRPIARSLRVPALRCD